MTDHYDEIEVVNVVDVQFAPYQRGLSQEHVNKLASNWNDDRCDVLVLSRRSDGSLYCIDGQHRVKAAMKAKVKELLARVLRNLTYEQEADLFFNAQEMRRGMRPTDAWNASLEAKHPATVEINSIVNSLGGRVNRHPDPDRGINCPTTLWKIHEYAEPQTLYDLLGMINDAWPPLKLGGPSSDANMLSGAMFFIWNHGSDVKQARLIKNLSGTTPVAIRDTARRYKDLGRKIAEGYYQAILDTYNKGLRDDLKLVNKKCDWRTIKAERKKAEAEEQHIRKTTR